MKVKSFALCALYVVLDQTQAFSQVISPSKQRRLPFVARSPTSSIQKKDITNPHFQLQAETTSVSSDSDSNSSGDVKAPSFWPCGDEMDKSLLKIAIPMTFSFALTPLMGAIDLFFVNRMGNPLAIAGQAASNQLYNIAFWMAAFLPSVTATLVAKDFAKGDTEAVQDSLCQALFAGTLIALFATAALFFRPEAALASVLKGSAPAMEYAKPYLMIRAFSFLPGIISLIGFSAYRGTLDMMTPVKITMLSNALNAILDPIMIFVLKLGVSGAAAATLAAEVVAAASYLVLLRRKKLIRFSKIFRLPAWSRLEPLIRGGLGMQLRLVALNITFLAVARVTQGIDPTGVAASAHAMALQTFQIGGVVLLALSTAAQTVVPAEMVKKTDPKTGAVSGGLQAARYTSNRMMSWGGILGVALAGLQIAFLPWIFRATPIKEVRAAARMPSIVASLLQAINGLVFIGEGIMVGCGNFMQVALSTIIATVGCLWSLKVFPNQFGLTGVWMGFGVFNLLRLIGVYIHQFYTSPITPAAVAKEAEASA